ncbi:MAG: GDP-mannose 4,6-dehydratase [Leptospiraceae bacterium]|nr:GDP-mannose 4,6-dehydratase [Leptospiraceae bacterium]
MKKAFITGISGQDGAYLAHSLLQKGYHVIGGVRKPDADLYRLNSLGIQKSIELTYFDLNDKESILNSVKKIKPEEIYNLAAQSSVGKSFHAPLETAILDGMAVAYFLESIRTSSALSKFFQAGSTEMFGNCKDSPQNEKSIFQPINPYSSAKVFAHNLASNYRTIYNLFIVNGILFNHESELRGKEFFTRKVTRHVAKVAKGKIDILDVGNIDAERDIGYAKEFVEAIYLTLQNDVPEDFIISTGRKTTIRSFIEFSFEAIGIQLEWKGIGFEEKGYNSKTGDLLIQVNQANFRPADIDIQWGNPEKIKKKLGWEAKCSVKEIASRMVENDIRELEFEIT